MLNLIWKIEQLQSQIITYYHFVNNFNLFVIFLCNIGSFFKSALSYSKMFSFCSCIFIMIVLLLLVPESNNWIVTYLLSTGMKFP